MNVLGVVKWACGAVVVCLGMDVSAMNEGQPSDYRISGVTCKGNEVGFYLLDEEWRPYERIQSFGDFLKYVRDYPMDIPTTEKDFNEFVSGDLSTEKIKALFRVSYEVIFCCTNHENPNEQFEKLEKFANLLENFENSELREMLGREMVSALETDYYNLMRAIDDSGRSKEEFLISDLIKEYNKLFVRFAPKTVNFKLTETPPYFAHFNDREEKEDRENSTEK